MASWFMTKIQDLKFFLPLLFFSLLFVTNNLNADESTPPSTMQNGKYVIIKADDLTECNDRWIQFWDVVKSKNVKVSMGVICEGLVKNQNDTINWIRKLHDTGNVEFWNHGWDHKKWEKNKETIFEFSKSGYEHQKDHLEKAQKTFLDKLGFPLSVFGAPYSLIDSDTAKAIAERDDIRGIFAGATGKELFKSSGKILIPPLLKTEFDGVGMPDFAKFKVEYEKQKDQLHAGSILFHPPWFKENRIRDCEQIIGLLKAEGWQFILPSEYISMQKPETVSK